MPASGFLYRARTAALHTYAQCAYTCVHGDSRDATVMQKTQANMRTRVDRYPRIYSPTEYALFTSLARALACEITAASESKRELR